MSPRWPSEPHLKHALGFLSGDILLPWLGLLDVENLLGPLLWVLALLRNCLLWGRRLCGDLELLEDALTRFTFVLTFAFEKALFFGPLPLSWEGEA